MFLDGGRKPEYPERTITCTGRTRKLCSRNSEAKNNNRTSTTVKLRQSSAGITFISSSEVLCHIWEDVAQSLTLLFRPETAGESPHFNLCQVRRNLQSCVFILSDKGFFESGKKKTQPKTAKTLWCIGGILPFPFAFFYSLLLTGNENGFLSPCGDLVHHTLVSL